MDLPFEYLILDLNFHSRQVRHAHFSTSALRKFLTFAFRIWSFHSPQMRHAHFSTSKLRKFLTREAPEKCGMVVRTFPREKGAQR